MIKVGIVGWRGMVGSVLVERMIKKNDFNKFEPIFFSTLKNIKSKPNIITKKIEVIENAYDIKKLATMQIIVSCQGSKYTKKIHTKLRKSKWKGYWIDSASELRMNQESIIVLDPINREKINSALLNGVLDYIGGNCTVSLMLMALHGLLKKDCIEWITSMTYQGISGAGANKLKEMLLQMQIISSKTNTLVNKRESKILDIDRIINKTMHNLSAPFNPIGKNLIAANLIPWIDKEMGNGQSCEEWKGLAETNKILGLNNEQIIPVDGQCVRVSTVRCHSQALTIKLKKEIPIKEIETAIETSNKWVKLIANNKKDTISNLTPAAVSGKLSIHIGRLRKLNVGNNYITAFTVGDQLLWGAAEPIRRILNIIINYIS